MFGPLAKIILSKRTFSPLKCASFAKSARVQNVFPNSRHFLLRIDNAQFLAFQHKASFFSLKKKKEPTIEDETQRGSEALSHFQNLTRIAEENPTDPSAQLNLARACEGFGHKELAAKLYTHIAKTLDPKNADAHFYFGMYLRELGEYDAATTALNEAQKLNLDDYKRAILQSSVAIHRGTKEECEKGIETLLAVIESHPEEALAYRELFDAYMSQKDSKSAIEYIKLAIEKDPYYIASRLRYGRLLTSMGNTKEALIQFQQVIQMNPESEEALLNIANSLITAKQYSPAIEVLQRVLNMNPHLGQAHHYLGAIYANQGQRVKAIESFKQAVEYAPHNAGAWLSLGKLYSQEGLFESSVSTFEKALENIPNHPLLLWGLGGAYHRNGILDQAIDLYEQAIEANPHFIDARMHLALALTKQERWSEAVKQYDAVLVDQPNNAAAQKARIEIVQRRPNAVN